MPFRGRALDQQQCVMVQQCSNQAVTLCRKQAGAHGGGSSGSVAAGPVLGMPPT